MTGFDLPTALFSGFIGAMLASYLAHVFTYRRDRIRDMQEKVAEIERVYSHLIGLNATFTRSYARFLRARAKLEAHLQLERIGTTTRDPWLITLGADAISTAVEYIRERGNLSETIGVILIKLEITQKSSDLVKNLAEMIQRGEDKFAATGPGSLTTQDAIDEWLREREREIVIFCDKEISPAIIRLLEYLGNERDNKRNDLGREQKRYWKLW